MTDEQIRRLRGVDIGGADQAAETAEPAAEAEEKVDEAAVEETTVEAPAEEAEKS
jgi:hypothetical protein